ncbi:MAG: hypothetical protein ACOVOO_11650 [Flavobacteriales bacterium]
MKLSYFLVFIYFLFAVSKSGKAQFTPDAFNYQAVARNVGGVALANQNLTVRMSVCSDVAGNDVLFEEIHSTVTNDFGLFALEIGHGISTGTAPYFSLEELPWGNGATYLKVEIDVPAAGGYELLGVSPLLMVPYAAYAALAPEADPTNELITDFSLTGSTLAITENNGTPLEVDLSAITGDPSPTNEWITSALLTNNQLTIDENGHQTTIDLSSLVGGSSAWQWNNNSISTSAVQVGVGTTNPSSSMQVNGSMAYSVGHFQAINDAVIETFEFDGFIHIAICDVTDGSMNILLPAASSCPGREYRVRKFFTTPTTNNVIGLVAQSGDAIEGGVIWSMNKPTAEYASLVSDGANWYVIDHSWE